jgi:acyl-CoA oxidase
VAKTTLAIAVRYGALRRQFGPPDRPETRILDYPSHQQRLLPLVADSYAHHFALRDLQRRWREHEGDDTREIEALAAGLKASATWHAIAAAQTARETCGGMGFLTVNRICQLRKDVDVFATFEGDNVVLLQLVAKSLLTGYAAQLSESLVGTLMRQVGQRAATRLIEQNPVARRRTAEDHIDGVELHRDALRFRTHNLLVSAARRVKKRTDDGMDAFDAFTDIQDHCVALAIAHVEEHVHACFADAVMALPEGEERRVLERVRALHGVSRLLRDVGWFLENDYMDGSKARAIRKRLGALCRELRPSAVALVDAFGIPDEVLAAPIAFEGYAEHAMLAQRRDGG